MRRASANMLGYLSLLILISLEVSKASIPPPEGAPSPTANTVTFYSDSGCVTPLRLRDTETKKGQGYFVYAWDDSAKKVEITEAQRHSRFYNDVQTVLGGVIGKPAAAGNAPASRKCVQYSHVLANERATLTVTAFDYTDTAVKSVTVIIGPTEHAWLGFDLPVNNSKTLKYDSASSSLLPQSSNPQLFLSFNYQLGGDLAAAAGSLAPTQNFSLKAFINASSRPLDSVGVGAGFRLGNISVQGYRLDAFSIWGGYFWTREDAVEAGKPQLNSATARAWRFGVTYDLATASKWVHW